MPPPSALLPLLLLPLLAFSQRLAGPRGALPLPQQPHSGVAASFDYLMLTQIFPRAVCRADDDAVPGSCEIPSGAPAWTVHGLWPNYSNGSYPQFCDKDKRFDPALIEPILEELTLSWPNLFPHKSADSFWKHEWEKHGTCSEGEEVLSTELKYFNITLGLRRQYDIEKALQTAGVPPSKKGYDLETIRAAVKSELTGGLNVQINCLNDKKFGHSLLGDVRLCLDKHFQPIDCPREKAFHVHAIQQWGRQRGGKGGKQPLPNFRPCPAHNVIYLSEDADDVQMEPVVESFWNSDTLHSAVQLCALVVLVILLGLVTRDVLAMCRPRKVYYQAENEKI